MKALSALPAATIIAALAVSGCSGFESPGTEGTADTADATSEATGAAVSAGEREEELPSQEPTEEPQNDAEPTEDAVPTDGLFEGDFDASWDDVEDLFEGLLGEGEDLTEPDNLGSEDQWEEYDRAAFPHWEDIDGTGCDARNETLERDLTTFESDGCVVEEGVLDDPFTGEIIYFERGGDYENSIDIDHIVPLEYAASNGNAMSWDEDMRRMFANDPANLLAVDPGSNRSKGSAGPSEWLVPDNASYRCEYATQFETVAAAYGIELPEADARAIADAC